MCKEKKGGEYSYSFQDSPVLLDRKTTINSEMDLLLSRLGPVLMWNRDKDSINYCVCARNKPGLFSAMQALELFLKTWHIVTDRGSRLGFALLILA